MGLEDGFLEMNLQSSWKELGREVMEGQRDSYTKDMKVLWAVGLEVGTSVGTGCGRTLQVVVRSLDSFLNLLKDFK